MDWQQHKAHWPHAGASQFIDHIHHWHIQQMGAGPDLVLIHGAGGATQSWRGMMPLLAQTYRVTAMDLPGQGFTRRVQHPRCGLDDMARDLSSLLRHIGITKASIVAHSAGVAIALRMAEMGQIQVRHITGFNAALGRFEGMAGWLFPLAAKALVALPFAPHVFARTGGTQANVDRLLRSTGSKTDAEMQRLYHLLASDADHVAGTLRMMADWHLDGLLTRLPRVKTPVHFITGDNDRTVPPTVSATAHRRLPHATLTPCPRLGHLLHEEAPDLAASYVFDI